MNTKDLAERMSLRLATDEDSEHVIKLIDAILMEHNDRACLTGSESDLTTIESSYQGRGGAIVVLLDGDKIIGTHAVMPIEKTPAVCTFRRLYLDQDYRGTIASTRLMQWAIDYAKEAGFKRVEFWSDTRFERAHKFFEKFAFEKTGLEREMTDSFEPYSEFQFARELT